MFRHNDLQRGPTQDQPQRLPTNEQMSQAIAKKPKRKRGGQPGNRNAVQHGLTTGHNPRGCSSATRYGNQFKRSLEAEVQALRGEITFADACSIQSATEWYRHALRARHWLNKKGDELSADQQLTFSREVARALTERDKIIRVLGVDRLPDPDDWTAAIFGPATDGATHDEHDTTTPPATAEATPAGQPAGEQTQPPQPAGDASADV